MSSIDANPGVRDRQRIAWTILLGSFFVCVLLTISIPAGIVLMLQNSTTLLDVMVQANEGTVRIDNASGGSDALLSGTPEQAIEPDETVVTGNTQTALLFFAPPESEQRLARVQIYSNTLLRLINADTPRFTMSDNSPTAALRMENGRILISIPEFEERPFLLTINTPQGRIELMEPGQYAILVTNEATQVSVQEGRATVSAVVEAGFRDVVDLVANQRGEIPTGSGPQGPLQTDRALLVNGDFSEGESSWTFFSWIVDQVNQPKGRTAVTYTFGEPRLHIIRDGTGHADVRFRQSVRQDVTDLEELKLAMTFRILGQTLGVCGFVGSECPLFIRINYVDTGGITQTWQQGFYATGEIDANATPDVCVSCAVVQNIHQRVPLEQDFFYEVDFPTELARQGALPPRFIESVEVVSSGHAFNVEVVNIDLLAVD
ncbi:MAG: hypothetical protein DWQ04_00595 [Chloroflexi bacterium]|nr:MAG: hypothetical protein DWQ04_00595 [Chloroflexota bacterium]